MSRQFTRVLYTACGISALCALLLAQPTPAPKQFTLVYNVNNAGYIDVCGCKHKEIRQGSLTRRASFLKQLRATGRELLLLDGGSSLFPIEDRVKEADLPEAMRSAELILEAYNRMGYRALAVGAFDLAAGLDNLKKLEKKARFPFLSANLADKTTGQLYFPPHIVVEAGGVKVGVVGLTLNTLGRIYLGKVAPTAVVNDPIEAARKSLDDLRGKVDLVVALSHLREETNAELIEKLKEIEIVIDPYIQYGNHHTWIKEDEWATSKGETLLLRGDGQGARLGVVDIKMVASRAKLVSEERLVTPEELHAQAGPVTYEKPDPASLQGKNLFRFLRVSLEPHHGNDPEVDDLVRKWKEKADPATVPPAQDPLPRKKDFVTVDNCKTCHPRQYEFWKSTRHADAYTSLIERGDETRFDCIGCHSLGYGEAFLDIGEIGAYSHVQCESCHGTSLKHGQDPAKFPYARVKKEDCTVCHNKEITGKEFDFYGSKLKVQCPKG
jgi:2',3'-cyclic-nucleotide 2'-phosphodiesterase (5'-nucleotidase family)